jgi:hypothetical protein
MRAPRLASQAVVSALAAALLFSALDGCRACEATSAGSSPDASADGAPPSLSHASDARAPSESTADSEDSSPSTPGPDGWLPVDYRASCGFFYAPSAERMPSPIRWTDCATAVNASPSPVSLACRQMAPDWPASTRVGFDRFFVPTSAAWVRPDGAVTLQINRGVAGVFHRVVADADGPVRQAIWDSAIRCTLGTSSLAAGHIVYGVSDDVVTGTLGPYDGGALGGTFDDPKPRTIVRHEGHDQVVHTYAAGKLGALENASRIVGWDSPSTAIPAFPTVLLTANDNGLLATDPFFVDDALFWMASTRAIHRLEVWTRATGTRELLRARPGIDEWREGFADLGSDGKDMVWERGTDRADPTQSFRAVTLYTAPYTTEPSRLVPRRLRSELPGSLALSPFVVGCGYAAHSVFPPNAQGALRIVRLATGESWLLEAPLNGPWQWLHPLAITCDEIFAEVHTPEYNVARVRLASLGPSIAPD